MERLETTTRSPQEDTRVMQVIDLDDTEDDEEKREHAIIKEEDSSCNVLNDIVIQASVPQDQAITILDSDNKDEVPPGIYQPPYTDDTDKGETEDSDDIIMSEKPFDIPADNTVVINEPGAKVKIEDKDKIIEDGLQRHSLEPTPTPLRTTTPGQALPAIWVKPD